MKRVLCPVLFLLFTSYAHAAPQGDDLLRAMWNAERSVSLSATETLARAGAPTVVSNVQRKGEKKRVAYSAPAILKGDVLVDNGQTVWRFHRAENSAIKTQTAPRASAGDRSARFRRFSAQMQGETKIIGRRAWIVALMPRGQTRVLRKLWVDQQTKIRLRIERFDDSGKRVEAWSLSNLKFEKIPDEAFQYTPPRGAEVTNAGVLYQRLNQAQRATNWLRVPRKLPRGFGFESAIVDEEKGEAWLRYSSGTRRFSIFQQRTKDQSPATLKPVGSGWYWKKNGNRFLIAGLPEAQANLVAKSVK
jgi:outer membrane lipoprotein-sorting protein